MNRGAGSCSLRQGGLIPMGVSVGDKVLLPEYGGQAIKLDGEELHLFREDDILVSTSQLRPLPVAAPAPADDAAFPREASLTCALLRVAAGSTVWVRVWVGCDGELSNDAGCVSTGVSCNTREETHVLSTSAVFNLPPAVLISYTPHA